MNRLMSDAEREQREAELDERFKRQVSHLRRSGWEFRGTDRGTDRGRHEWYDRSAGRWIPTWVALHRQELRDGILM